MLRVTPIRPAVKMQLFPGNTYALLVQLHKAHIFVDAGNVSVPTNFKDKCSRPDTGQSEPTGTISYGEN